MFPSLKSPGSSPCPSPVRELAASLQRAGSPCKNKYKSLVGSKEPMISRGRLTMTGGFTDLRPRPIDKEDSLESEEESSCSTYSSRSDSCDSDDPVLEPKDSKPAGRYFKIPRKAMTAAMGHLSPRLQKKLMKVEEPPAAPQHPMWPCVMATYGRGVSTLHIQNITAPSQPSLTAMNAQAILDERRDIRAALQMLAYKAELQRQMETLSMAALQHYNLEDDDDGSFDSVEDDTRDEQDSEEEATSEDEPSPLAPHETFPINPAITVRCSEGRTGIPDEGFQEESLLEALDLDTVPTLTPEELLQVSVSEVHNVHVVCDYVVLETAPPRDSVTV